MSTAPSATVAVIGGGLAGLAAACALADSGLQVTLLERRPYLGGRASSYQHPGTGEVVDNCQHVLLGCCTNLLDFYERTGVAGKIRWFDRLTFVEPGGRQTVISPSWLPAPLHCALSFLRADSLALGDKFAIARAMTRLAFGVPWRDEPFLDWLHRHRQTPAAIERFWKVVLVSALNEDLDRMSTHYAAQVFRESFLKSAPAGRMGVPSVPLTELYNASADYIRTRGGDVRLRCPVESLAPAASGVSIIAGGEELRFDFAVLATPWDIAARLLPESLESLPLHQQLSRFAPSPITGIHLWFDRVITDLPHAVLLDRTIQWMFHKSMLLTYAADTKRVAQAFRPANAGPAPGLALATEVTPAGAHDTRFVSGHGFSRAEAASQMTGASAPAAEGSYLELVVSSSKSLVEKPKGEIIALALQELAEFFPAAREAQLLKSTVIKEVNATWSPAPGSDAHRPPQATSWPNLFLAGDWTATGWPATMEGAVRSGYLAAEALTARAGSPRKLLVPDLPARGLMRLLR
jgi:squalene-associated FAD-dependent desaturase